VTEIDTTDIDSDPDGMAAANWAIEQIDSVLGGMLMRLGPQRTCTALLGAAVHVAMSAKLCTHCLEDALSRLVDLYEVTTAGGGDEDEDEDEADAIGQTRGTA
jgi:hypothetical protein